MTEIRQIDRAATRARHRAPEDDFFSYSWMYFALAALTLILALLGSLTYNVVKDDLTESAISVRTSVTALAANSVSQEFRSVVEVGRALATRVRFGELVAVARWREAASIMAAVPGDFAEVEQVLLFSADGALQ